MSTESDAVVTMSLPLQGCALVTLNRPEAKNAMSGAVRRRLVQLLESELRGKVQVVVLTGAGGNFSAGLDLRELGSSGRLDDALTPAEDVVRAMRCFDGVIIGAVDGVALTGGLEVALACDVLLASENACFADTHALVGVLPGWGLSQVLARRIGDTRAKQMSLTCEFLDAQRALAWGLVNQVVPPAGLLPEALRQAALMLAAAPGALVATKRLIDDGEGLALGEALDMERRRSLEWAASLTPETLEARAVEVIRRGRVQPRKF